MDFGGGAKCGREEKEQNEKNKIQTKEKNEGRKECY